jgi:hypothetical protein
MVRRWDFLRLIQEVEREEICRRQKEREERIRTMLWDARQRLVEIRKREGTSWREYLSRLRDKH